MNTYQKQVLERWKRLVAVPTVEKNPYRVLKATISIPQKLQNIKLSGESLWGKESGIAKCTEILFELHFDNYSIGKETEYYILLYVFHNRNWEIYTDKMFEKGISAILTQLFGGGGAKVKVCFTEQDMQENKVASLENFQHDIVGSSILADFIMQKNDL